MIPVGGTDNRDQGQNAQNDDDDAYSHGLPYLRLVSTGGNSIRYVLIPLQFYS
jgi:hypothetical protein